MQTLEDRITRLEAESQIRQLVARYCFYIDDRLIDRIPTLFTPDAELRSADGVMNASGVDTIMAQFHGRDDVLGPGHHFMHEVQIDFEGNDTARGRVYGHADLSRQGPMMDRSELGRLGTEVGSTGRSGGWK